MTVRNYGRLVAFVASFLIAFTAYAQEPLTPTQFTEDFDTLWSHLKENYAYFDRKATDWNRVREIYRPRFSEVSHTTDFITLLERVLDELYDPHTHLKVNTARSTRLVPTGLDVWAEWIHGRAIVTQLRNGFSAEQAGLRVGMQIISINGIPVETAIRNRLGTALREVNDDARSWALRALLAGTHDTPRTIQAYTNGGARKEFRLDLPGHRTADHFQPDRRVEWRILNEGFGYIKVNDLGSDETVVEFDAALEKLMKTRGLILDLRATQSGGNTSVAEPIMGRFIDHTMAYQMGTPTHGESWIREVSPVGSRTYTAPLAVLVGRWTASIGEGIAIGLDAMKRATIVGTRMAGLNGAVFDVELPNTHFHLNYAAEKLFHMNGTPREEFVPPVEIEVTGRPGTDEILQEGVRVLKSLTRRTRNKP